jgi:EAL and modified HD-GYP domain-containing signal transduction protein
VNVERDMLFSDALEILPRDQVVLEILETVKPSRMVVQRCRALKAAGFSLALDDHHFDESFAELYGIVDVVKVDLLASADAAARTVERLAPYPVKLLAEKVETSEQFRECLDLGFHFFQGFHFARPATIERRRIDEAGATLLKLLRLLAEDAETREIEAAFRESPGLTYKLLILVNSVMFGSRERIGSLRQAITMLGRSQMKRWLQLALFASDARKGLDDPLVDMAAVRASLMEALVRLHPELSRMPEACENAFMTGVLSVLDSLFDVSMSELVASLHLCEAVGAALTAREGALGQLLVLAERMERLELDAASAQLQEMGIAQDAAVAAQQRAFAWRDALR